MPYTSPVALLSPQQIASFTSTDFKKVKNELLLLFQLSDEPTIAVHDRMYDKDEMVRLFELLQENPELHLAIFRNTELLLFLEEHDLRFFQNGIAQNTVLQDPAHVKAITILIAEEINEVLPGEILSFDSETKTLLWQISLFMAKVDPEIMSMAYQDTFAVLKNFVDNLKEKYPVPYISDDNRHFHPEMEYIVSMEFLEFFRFLPPAFDYCRIKYCTWCNNHVVVPFSELGRRFSEWPRASLIVVKEANAIAATLFNKEGHLTNASRIDEYLNAAGSGGGGWRLVLGIFLLVGSLIKMGNACNRMDRKDRYQQRDYFNNSISQEHYQKLNETYRQQLSHEKKVDVLVEPNPVKKSSGIRASQFNGSAELKPGYYRIKETKDKADATIITVETNIIPTNTKEFLPFIPESANKKFAGTQRSFHLVFQRSGIPEVSFEHEMDVHFGKTNQLVYRSAGISRGRQVVSVKTYSGFSKTLKGFVTRMDPLGGIQRVDTIDVTLDATGAIASIRYNHLETKTGYSSDYNTDGLWRRTWCAVHNITRLNGITLKPDFAQEIKDIASYSFVSTVHENAPKLHPFRRPDISRRKEELYYLETSREDGVAYFTAAQYNYDIKYLIDTQSGMVKGIQMALLSQDKQEVERVELFSVD